MEMKIGLQIFENESSEHVCFQIFFLKCEKQNFLPSVFSKSDLFSENVFKNISWKHVDVPFGYTSCFLFLKLDFFI